MNVQFPGLGFSVDVNPVVFEIGGLSVHWYGVIIASGFLLAVIYALTSAKKFFLNSDKLFDAVLLGVVTGIVGARLYYVLFYPTVNGPNPYFQDPVKILYIWEGGLAIYGGVIGGLLGGILMAKIRKINILAMLDLGVLGFLIGQGIGRWGNFINQEAFGVETSLPWGMLSQNTIRAGFEGRCTPVSSMNRCGACWALCCCTSSAANGASMTVRFSCCTSSGMAWSVLWWRAFGPTASTSPVSICACLRCSPPPPPLWALSF